MNWKELLLNLGTPVIETLIAEEIGDVVVFQRSGEEFIVIESTGVMPKRAIYSSEDEIKEEFPSYNLVRVTDEIYYLLRKMPDGFNEIVRVEELSERFRSIEKLESRIEKHIYQLEGMDAIISSLLEPFPMDILLSMVLDAISELFVTSSALYELKEEEYSLVMNIGSKDFPESFDASQVRNATRVSTILDAGNITGYDGLIIPISEDLTNKYLIFVRREEDFAPEERALLTAIMKILIKSRESIRSREKELAMDKLISQMRFVMESLGEFAMRSLSIHDEEELAEMTVDMMREMLQASWAAIYEVEDEELLFKWKSSVRKVELPLILKIRVEDMVWKPKRVEGISEEVWLAVPIVVGESKRLVVLVGSPITKDFLNPDIMDLYVEIIFKMIRESFGSIEYESELKRREEKIRRLYESMIAIENFSKRLRRLSDPGEVYELIYKYASENAQVDGMKAVIRGISTTSGKEVGEKLVVVSEDGGEITFYKLKGFSEFDRAVLKVLAEEAVAILKDLYLLVPSEKILGVDEIKFRFLREKAKRYNIPEENLRFYVIRHTKKLEKISEIGVGIVDDGKIFVATDRTKEELEKMGYEVEELY